MITARPLERAVEPSLDLLDLFLAEVGLFPLLKVHEERLLAARIAQGDADAKRAMIEANLRLVIWCAKRYRGYGPELLDLIQDGVLGLIVAAERYDLGRGCRFSTYAIWCIRGAITKSLRSRGYDVRRSAAGKLIQMDGGQPPSTWPGESAMHLPAGGSGLLLGETTSSEDCHDLEALALALQRLVQRERAIIELRFGLGDSPPRTLEAVGTMLGLSHERVRQIQSAALQRLRAALAESSK